MLTPLVLALGLVGEAALVFLPPQEAPSPGEGGVVRNAAHILPVERGVVAGHVIDPLTGEPVADAERDDSVPGLTILRLPPQPANGEVRIARELDADGDGVIDAGDETSWSTGLLVIEEQPRPPRVQRAEIETDLFAGTTRVVVDAGRDPNRAALVLLHVEDDDTRTLGAVAFNAETVSAPDEDARVWELIGVDRAGQVTDPVSVDLSGGCAQTGLSPGTLMLGALLVVRRARRSAC